jgi:hypothetical protein
MTIRLARFFLAAALFFVGTGVGHALEGPGRALMASNVLKLSADTQRSGFFIVKEFIVPYAGVVRMRYQFKSDGLGPQTVTVSPTTSIDFNNSCGTTTSATTFQNGTCDLKVVAGDRVRFQAQGQMAIFPATGQSTPTVRNVRLFWNVVDSAGTGSVLQD